MAAFFSTNIQTAGTDDMTLISRWSRRLRTGPAIIVVSGLPRSGTSMAMRMLHAGGLPLLTDGARASDANNPAGYFEFEPVKQLDKNGDLAWLRTARGKGVKVISWLLTWLPETYDYQVIFMHRALDEVIASQHAMLRDRGDAQAIEDAVAMAAVYTRHLQQVERFLEQRRCFTTIAVNYGDAIDDPSRVAQRLAAFLRRPLDVARMAAAVDSGLYRNRSERRAD
jgi:hypothetical protein